MSMAALVPTALFLSEAPCCQRYSTGHAEAQPVLRDGPCWGMGRAEGWAVLRDGLCGRVNRAVIQTKHHSVPPASWSWDSWQSQVSTWANLTIPSAWRCGLAKTWCAKKLRLRNYLMMCMRYFLRVTRKNRWRQLLYVHLPNSLVISAERTAQQTTPKVSCRKYFSAALQPATNTSAFSVGRTILDLEHPHRTYGNMPRQSMLQM